MVVASRDMWCVKTIRLLSKTFPYTTRTTHTSLNFSPELQDYESGFTCPHSGVKNALPKISTTGKAQLHRGSTGPTACWIPNGSYFIPVPFVRLPLQLQARMLQKDKSDA